MRALKQELTVKALRAEETTNVGLWQRERVGEISINSSIHRFSNLGTSIHQTMLLSRYRDGYVIDFLTPYITTSCSATHRRPKFVQLLVRFSLPPLF